MNNTDVIAPRQEWATDLINLIEGRFPAQRGRAIAGYLAGGGFTNDPFAFMADYEKSREVIDPWLARIDLHKIVSRGSGSGSKAGFRFPPTLLLGIALGSVATILIFKAQQ